MVSATCARTSCDIGGAFASEMYILRSYSREVEYTPEPEMPARFAEQTFALLRGVAVVRQHQIATADDIRIVTRVALDSIPAVRRRGLAALLRAEGTRDTSALATD